MASKERPVVHVQNGGLEGIYLDSRGGRFFAVFLGIPYGDKPERFEVAKPASNWSGLRDASKYGPECTHYCTKSRTVVGSDDSLTLNVFVPYDHFRATTEVQGKSLVNRVVSTVPKLFRRGTPASTENEGQRIHNMLSGTHKFKRRNLKQATTPGLDADLSVLVYIHGGRFQSGSAEQYGAEYLIDENVIVVTFNYRLGPLGFLATGDDVIPGNLGLKDQYLALKWVHNNIKYFGGNPKDVTLYGTDAGAAAVSLQMVSPLSRGLFHKTICSSGSCFNEWVFQEDPKRNAIDLVRAMSGRAVSSEEIKSFLKSCSAEDICRVSQADKNPLHNPIFVPIIEHPAASLPFICESPRAAYARADFAKVPLLITANAEEGLAYKSCQIMKKPDYLHEINERWFEAAPHLYHYEHLASEEKRRISEDFHRFYFENKIPPVTDENFGQFTDSFTDVLFIFGIRELGIMHAVHSPTYAGILDIKGTWSTIEGLGYPDSLGMAHGDEIQYVFNSSDYPKFSPGSEGQVASQRLVRIICNFVKFGDPNYDQMKEEWQPITEADIHSRDLNWMYIRNRECVPHRLYLARRMKFCDQFYQGVGMI